MNEKSLARFYLFSQSAIKCRFDAAPLERLSSCTRANRLAFDPRKHWLDVTFHYSVTFFTLALSFHAVHASIFPSNSLSLTALAAFNQDLLVNYSRQHSELDFALLRAEAMAWNWHLKIGTVRRLLASIRAAIWWAPRGKLFTSNLTDRWARTINSTSAFFSSLTCLVCITIRRQICHNFTGHTNVSFAEQRRKFIVCVRYLVARRLNIWEMTSSPRQPHACRSRKTVVDWLCCGRWQKRRTFLGLFILSLSSLSRNFQPKSSCESPTP